MSETATITALVHGKQTAVSFRHLSSLLNVPTRKAQTLLCDFAASDPTVTTLWCVTELHPKTGILRTSLTTTPPTGVKKQIWAVGPPSTANAPSQQAVWLVSDAARDRALVTEPSHIQNELRDGRWNRIRSQSGEWDAQLDPRLGGDERLASGPAKSSSAKLNSSSLLASVKAKAKGKKTKAKGFMGGAFKSSSGTSASLFASKPLGSDAMNKMRNSSSKLEQENEGRESKVKTESESSKDEVEITEKNKPEPKKKGKRRSPSKKARRVVDDESDNEGQRSAEEADPDADAEDNEEEKCMRELEREAAEKEKADAERAEIEQELMDLNRVDVDEEPESPELKEPADDREPVSPVPRPEELSGSPDSGKRSFWQTFGDAPNDSKRIRKEIEETVEENGYIVTRRVVKIFDEHGNEVKDSGTEKPLPEANHAVSNGDAAVKTSNPFRPKNHQPGREKVLTSSLKKDKIKDLKRPTSKLGATLKKTPKKKIKGNIMSYFGKKT